MLTVRFIRHAQSVSNNGGFTEVYEQIELSDYGRQQAVDIAQTITQAPDVFVLSGYLRTQMTAAPSIKKFPKVPVEIWPEVREFKYLGENHIKGKTNRSMRAPFAEAFWEQADPNLRDGPGAETFAELIDRVHATLDKLHQLAQKGVENIVIFSHSQFMMALRAVLNAPTHPIDSVFMRNFWKEKKSHLIPNGCGYFLTVDPASGEDKTRDYSR